MRNIIIKKSYTGLCANIFSELVIKMLTYPTHIFLHYCKKHEYWCGA
jgi:hypothetical protein